MPTEKQRINITPTDAMRGVLKAYADDHNGGNLSAAATELIQAALEAKGYRVPPAPMKRGQYIREGENMSTLAKQLVDAYDVFADQSSTRPLKIAASAIDIADRRLFPDAESWQEIVAGQMLQLCPHPTESQFDAMKEFARLFVDEVFVTRLGSDTGKLNGKAFKQLVLACEQAARQ